MNTVECTAPPNVTPSLDALMTLPTTERLFVARLLLDSIPVEVMAEEIDWQQRGLSAFVEDWDNEEDAIYDNWRTLYGVSTC